MQGSLLRTFGIVDRQTSGQNQIPDLIGQVGVGPFWFRFVRRLPSRCAADCAEALAGRRWTKRQGGNRGMLRGGQGGRCPMEIRPALDRLKALDPGAAYPDLGW
jgi:hypothetical protein